MQAELINISKVKVNTGQIEGLPKNPRLIKDERFEKLVKSIQDDPDMLELRELIVFPLNGSYVTIAGNMRLKAMNFLGYKEVPCKVLSIDTPVEKLRAITIKDNIAYGENSWDDIANEWDEQELIEWGLEIPDFAVNKEVTEDDYEIPDEIKTDIVLGDLFEIGPHRLLCGDSTDSDSVAKLMNGQKADIAFTSPPYNAAKESHLNGRVDGFDGKYQSNADAMSDDDYLQFLYDFAINSIINSDYSFINIQLLAHNKKVIVDFQHRLIDYLKDILIWNKSQCPPNIIKGAFNTKWEYVFAFSDKCETRGFPCKWQGQYPNVIETENASGNEFAEVHKATFPISFPAWIIDKMDFAKSVLDLFIGTGTTMVAAHQLNRKCYGMEIDCKYCEVIVNRMLKLDNTLTIKRNGVDETDKWVKKLSE